MLHQLKDAAKELLRWLRSRESSEPESKIREMSEVEAKALAHRFQVIESCVGLLGCLCVTFAVWTPFWIDGQGLWAVDNTTSTDDEGSVQDRDWTGGDRVIKALSESERVFGVLAFMMAVCSGVLCLVFALCWTHDTVHSYTNTRSLLMVGTALNPTTLLLITLSLTGFFFLLSWALFTHHHRAEIQNDISRLGSSYWLGALGWVLLLAVEPVVFVVEQVVVPDLLPYMMQSAGLSTEGYDTIYLPRSHSESHHLKRQQKQRDDDLGFKRHTSVP
ncbi:uncharacterized protein si:ch211-256a21.4 [Sardina pilchardus]|uniref:uncharacterized protein si:ch211-256a21.4 n=1 Tax=Sardina pilchardus TaxID=27697 RepID=UPI002E10F607